MSVLIDHSIEEEQPLLDITSLSVQFLGEEKTVDAVAGITYKIMEGQTVALVGESGSGKSVSALSILQLLPYPQAHHPEGSSVKYRGQEIIGADDATMRKIRGNKISIIFQEPMTSLNPLHTIEKQINEVLLIHKGLNKITARKRTLELLKLVHLKNPAQRLKSYPHELSGGQRQRVMIAMALANEPDLLIADEPTTSLDVTIQAQILELLQELKEKLGMSILLITHDLGIVRKMATRVCVMKKGQIVEQGRTEDIFTRPHHPYTQELLAAEPKGNPVEADPEAPEIMACEDIKVYFPVKRGILRRTVDYIKAVDGISLNIKQGHTIGIVGESGSGKTTLGLAILRLIASKGLIRFDNKSITNLKGSKLRPLRQEMQIVFQDPYGSLSPRLSIEQIIEEGLKVHGLGGNAKARETLVMDALREVGLDPEDRNRYPHEFSGGQRQRIAIARAMVLKPKFLVLDEPTSALDMSVQAQIVDLLRNLQIKHNLTYLFISHDLKVVRTLADNVIVMRDGKAVETGTAKEIFENPQSPYTQALIKAAFDIQAVHQEAVNA